MMSVWEQSPDYRRLKPAQANMINVKGFDTIKVLAR